MRAAETPLITEMQHLSTRVRIDVMQDERVLANINTVIFIFNANHDSVILKLRSCKCDLLKSYF